MNIFFSSIIIAFLSSLSSQTFFKEKNGVLQLTEETFDKAIAEYSNVLVQFTSTWCGKCERIEKEYAKAAQLLSYLQPPVYLAQIDGYINANIKQRFNLKSYPVFIYFQNGKEILYQGGSEYALDFYNWMYKKTQQAVRLIHFEAQLQQEIEIHDTIVLYFGKTNIFEYIKIYEIIARRYDKAFFLRATDESELYGIFNVTKTPHVIMFRHFESNGLHFNQNWTARNLERWIVRESVPQVFHYDEEFAHHVFVHKHITVFLFRESKNETHNQLEGKFREIVQDLKNDPAHEEVLFAICDYQNAAHKKVADILGLERFDYPKIAIVHPHKEGVERYIFTEQDLHQHMTYHKLEEFLGHFRTGNLTRFLKIEDYENKKEYTDNSYWVIKGNQALKDFISQENKEKIVLFHAHFCQHCINFMPTFKDFAEACKESLEPLGLEIGMMDASRNDLDIRIPGYPTIIFFDTQGNEVRFNKARTQSALMEFVLENSKLAQKVYGKYSTKFAKQEERKKSDL